MTQWGLDVLFNPAQRHMDEAKLRQQSTRDEVGDSSGGKRIDLESGKVVISRKPKATDENSEASDVAAAEEEDAEAEATEEAERIGADDEGEGSAPVKPTEGD
jgi:hypothetical protein